MKVEPAFWLRRLTRFPFYFESHNASFRIHVQRVEIQDPKDRWPDDKIVVQTVFEDETLTETEREVPPLEVGETAELRIREVYVATPGQVIFRVPTQAAVAGGALRAEMWSNVYSYKVRTEESLWVSVFSPVLILGALTIGILCQPNPTVQNILEVPAPPTIAAKPTEPVTPLPERTAEDGSETPEPSPEAR